MYIYIYIEIFLLDHVFIYPKYIPSLSNLICPSPSPSDPSRASSQVLLNFLLNSDKLLIWDQTSCLVDIIFFLRKKCGCYSYSSYVHLQLIRVTGLLCCALMRIWQRCNCIPPNTMMMFWFKSKCFLAIANHFKSVILRYPSTSIPCHS